MEQQEGGNGEIGGKTFYSIFMDLIVFPKKVAFRIYMTIVTGFLILALAPIVIPTLVFVLLCIPSFLILSLIISAFQVIPFVSPFYNFFSYIYKARPLGDALETSLQGMKEYPLLKAPACALLLALGLWYIVWGNLWKAVLWCFVKPLGYVALFVIYFVVQIIPSLCFDCYAKCMDRYMRYFTKSANKEKLGNQGENQEWANRGEGVIQEPIQEVGANQGDGEIAGGAYPEEANQMEEENGETSQEGASQGDGEIAGGSNPEGANQMEEANEGEASQEGASQGDGTNQEGGPNQRGANQQTGRKRVRFDV